MAYKATYIGQDPLTYFLQHDEHGSLLHISDVLLRENKNPKEIFSHLIRMASASKWSHSAIVYLTSDPHKGYENTFLVEAKTKGINIVSWRNEVVPFDEFTVGIKRPVLDWYVETPYEVARHDPQNPEDTHAFAYLRHVRGIAMDQINGLYDKKTAYELASLYTQRAAKRHLSAIPQVADAAGGLADLFRKWDEHDTSATSVLRLICSGLVQYSFFEALRRRIMNDLAIPEHREAALSNLSNMHRVIFRADPEGIIPHYIEQVQSHALDIHDPLPADVMDLLKTAMPADFNNSEYLAWRYMILKGAIWQIYKVPEGYTPESEDEVAVLKMLDPEHYSSKK